MSGSRSRRVQAQRKFPQGAYVPPNAAVVPPVDNRRDAVHNAPNVTIIKMTASNLLDVVSLQGLHTHLQPVVIVERLRETNPCRDELEMVTKPRELVMAETDGALSVGNEYNKTDTQLRLGGSSISNKSSSADDVHFGNEGDKHYTNGSIVEESDGSCPLVDDLTLKSLIQSKNDDQGPKTNEQHKSNKDVNVTEPCTAGKESSGKSKQLIKESSTKGKSNIKGKANTKGKSCTKHKISKKGKGFRAEGNGVSEVLSNTWKQPRINDDKSLASVLRALQKTKDQTAQNKHVMSLRQRRLNNGKVCATTAKKLQTVKGKNMSMNKKKTDSSKRHSPSSEFSIDDNRPLTYYIQNNKTSKKSPNKRSHTVDPSTPDMLFAAPSPPKKIIIDPDVSPPLPDPIPKRLQINPELVAGPSGLQNTVLEPVAAPSGPQRVTTAPVAGPSGLQRVTSPPVTKPSGLQKVTLIPAAGSSGLKRVTSDAISRPSGPQRVTSASVAKPGGLQKVTLTPVAGPSGLQRVTSAPVAGPSGLQRVVMEPVAGPSGLQKVTSTPVAGPSGLQKRGLQSSGAPRQVPRSGAEICLSAKWRTVQQVINAPKEQMDTRCNTCVACSRIDKLKQLSKFLYRFDLTGTNQTSAKFEPENDEVYDNDDHKSPETDTGHIYLI